jgi:transcriptional regulator with XRE-family HTH domain
MDTVANRLKKALEIREINQSELVKRTGIGKSSISTYLSGEYEPKQRNIYKISKALNINEAWLMDMMFQWTK